MKRPNEKGVHDGGRGHAGGKALRGLLRALLPPVTIKAVAALLEPGTLQTDRSSDAMDSHCSAPRLLGVDLHSRKLSVGPNGPLSTTSDDRWVFQLLPTTSC